MRRLPVYLLIDISESMAGSPIREVANGINSMVAELRNDPYALETVFMAILAFAGKAESLVKLTEITDFTPPQLPVGSGTDLNQALTLLMDSIDKDVQKSTSNHKGDWKPIIFLFTDGAPTTDTSRSIERWQKHYRNKCNLVSVIFGTNADVPLLEKLGPQVFALKDTSTQAFKEFFKWVSASIMVSSVSVAENHGDGIKLADNRINLEKAIPNDLTDENFAILSMKCSKNKKMWLAKYDSHTEAPWPLIESCKIDEEKYNYFSAGKSERKFDTATLAEIPACPECGDNSMVLCGKCKQLSCAGIGQNHVCPWCGFSAQLNWSDNLSVTRNSG